LVDAAVVRAKCDIIVVRLSISLAGDRGAMRGD
jgi:hypothetical protein